MVEKQIEAADADRRRFLTLAAKLGLAVPPVVTLSLSKPSYAAGSGFSDPPAPGEFAALQQTIDQFVLHYDCCGLSRICFETLQARTEAKLHRTA